MDQLVSALVVGFVIFGSSVWVLIDAQRLGIKGGQRSLLSNSPAMWFVGCVGLWIIVFPLYLVARSRAIAQASQRSQNASMGQIPPSAPRSAVVNVPRPAGAPPWVGLTSLAAGIASIPAAIFGILAMPLWLAGLALGIWGVAAGGPGRKQAIGGIIASVVGFLAMFVAIALLMMWVQGRQS